MKKMVEKAHLTPAWCSYAGAMYSILNSSGVWKEEFWKLYGLSGMAFHFIVHQDCCPSSVTVYDWVNEHYYAMDRLGIFTAADELFFNKSLLTFSLKQQYCIEKIKDSIDHGKAVLVWAPTPCLEFGIINGYDDNEKLLLVEAVDNPKPDPLLYANLGLSEVPIIYCQYVLNQVPMDLNKSVLHSLQFGLSEWKKENHIHPQYFCGKKAYDVLIQALESPKLNAFGLSYILAVYQESKQVLYKFMDWISSNLKEFSGLEESALLFKQVADYFQKLHQLYPFTPGRADKPLPDQDLQKALRDNLQKAREREQRAMNLVEKTIHLH